MRCKLFFMLYKIVEMSARIKRQHKIFNKHKILDDYFREVSTHFQIVLVKQDREKETLQGTSIKLD